jgi:uncharacterized protein (DUF362 family)
MVAKGVSVKLTSYEETVPRVLDIIKFDVELAKHQTIILKPSVQPDGTITKVGLVEAVLKYCLAKKQAPTRVFIAEGSDGASTQDMFESAGYTRLAETYPVSFIDLNTAAVEMTQNGEFLKFQNIAYPAALKEAFVISLPAPREHPEVEYAGALANMLGAFPAKHYAGWFSTLKNKLREHPIKYAIHDILKVKMPDAAIIDASDKGLLFVGNALEMDKQAAKLYKGDWKNVQHLRLLEEASLYHQKRAEQRAREKELNSLMPTSLS